MPFFLKCPGFSYENMIVLAIGPILLNFEPQIPLATTVTSATQ